MNDLIQHINGQAVASTQIIAEGTGNSHESVIKLVRKYSEDLEAFGRVGFEIEPFETAGGVQKREIALLNERQATLLFTYMRNNDVVREFKKRLVSAFFELADKQPAIPQTLPEALRLAADLAEQNATLKPKAEALDRIATAEGSLCISDAAKSLQLRPKQLFNWLSAHGWIFKRHGAKHWLGYQEKVQQGLLEHKVTTSLVDGNERIFEQVRVTPKGLSRISESYVEAAA